MKNQALTATLAVLLAVTLSALVALVVSSEVIGTPADTPVSVPIEVVTPAPDAPTAELVADTNEGDPVAQPPATETPAEEAPATDDNAPIDTGDGIGNGEDTDSGEDTDGEDATDEDNTDGEDATDGDNDDDHPGIGDPPCEGTIVDGHCIPPVSILCLIGYQEVDGECVFVGCPPTMVLQDGICQVPDVVDTCDGTIIEGICVPDISILCLIGYEEVDGDCVFVGCPPTMTLQDGICTDLGVALPCEDGYFRFDGLCIPVLIFDPDVLPSICDEGEQLIGNICVPEFSINPDVLVPGLELAANG